MTSELASGGVTIVGIGQNILVPTFALASGAAETDIGLPVAADFSTGAMQVKPATDGDVIFGILQSYESDVQTGLKRGAVAIAGGFRLTYKTGDTVAAGDSVVSAGSGEVKKASAANRSVVVSKNATNETVDVLLGF